MYVTIDVSESRNCPMYLERVFEGRGEPKLIHQVVAPNPMGDDIKCYVTGWSSSGQCLAYGVLVEDSGEGILMLLYGGDEGLRLRPVSSPGDWDVNDSAQWGESCLLLHRDVELN